MDAIEPNGAGHRDGDEPSFGRDEIDLARTGPGTLAGRFMRRFWMPVSRAEDVAIGQAKPIRIMSEDFTLYRGQSGAAQVIDYRCPHRGAQMHLGWVEGDDIRCVYHGWKFDPSGQCIEQPAEEAGFARKVRTGSYPTREHLGLVFAYFGEGAPPAFPPYPAPLAEGLIENAAPPIVPCNYLQCFENSLDEVHVAFVHLIGGSHSGIYDLPEISAEETPWGMARYGRRGNELRVSLHYMPNCTRVLVPPMAGLDGEGGWRELYLNFTPIDDENNIWFITNLVRVTGAAADSYRAKREQYWRRQAEAGPAEKLAQQVMAGRLRFSEIDHPDRVRVQDIAVQAGQGRIADRRNERLGRSDTAIIMWRRMLAREMRAMAEGRPLKQWTPAPADVLPTLGF
ncbi:MAG: Rieske 2Fe-2S domain-containing protein [Alphaproteobacteria bacterium]|nr:Rieske 2Fe-2S domain-containing protein [Alphaproteobacteria bacterium]MBV9861443.1 Rieske 2Fe-2S domain-containing protein [Alphaproteobacteria bacterium]